MVNQVNILKPMFLTIVLTNTTRNKSFNFLNHKWSPRGRNSIKIIRNKRVNMRVHVKYMVVCVTFLMIECIFIYN